jgi:iron complex outermembrane recepter protein
MQTEQTVVGRNVRRRKRLSHFTHHAIAAAAMMAAVAPSFAADSPTQTIEVKGQGLRSAGAPHSITSLDAQQIRDAAVSQPEQLLRNVPGVEVRGYHLGGVVNVITIRGFSGGAHGGDLGMVIDGVPLNEAMSHADGYADLNVIVPLEIERFDVYRGPVSALYGNFNRGGLVAIESRRKGQYAEIDASLASFSTFDLQGAVGVKLGDAGQFNGAAQVFSSRDYRPDSKFDRGTFSGRYSLDLSASSKLSFSGRVHKGDWKSASYLLKTQFDAGDTYGKDARVINDGGSKNFFSGRVDFSHVISPELKLLAFAYGTGQDYVRWFTRPLNATTWSQREENYDRKVTGAGFSLNGKLPADALALQWVAGAEIYREATDYMFFEGSKDRARSNPAAYDRRYDFNSVSAFTELTAALAPWFRPTLGLRFDKFTGDCSKNGAETGADPCAKLNPAQRTTPKLGVRSTVLPGLDLRASVAEGFALPPNTAKYAGGGADLKPTIFKQNEMGVSYQSPMFRADLATYQLKSSNEVRTVSPGVFENFGRTERRGVELALTVLPLPELEIGLVANTARTEVLENANAALVGKQVTGVPRQSTTFNVAWKPAEGFGGSVELRNVGNSAVDAPNTLFYGAFKTLDLGLTHTGLIAGQRVRAYAKLENATDRKYATNAFLIGGQQLVAPAPPRSVQVGLQANF